MATTIDMSVVLVRRCGPGGAYGAPLDRDSISYDLSEEIYDQRRAGADRGRVMVYGQSYEWRLDTAAAEAIGERIGRAMARDARAESMPRQWTGLDAQDGDQAAASGIEPDTEAWEVMEAAARQAYERALAD